MTKCKECYLYEENKLLRDNLDIAQHFHEGLSMKWTELRVKMRAWGATFLQVPTGDSRIVASRNIETFWDILGEETPAERFEKTEILSPSKQNQEEKQP